MTEPTVTADDDLDKCAYCKLEWAECRCDNFEEAEEDDLDEDDDEEDFDEDEDEEDDDDELEPDDEDDPDDALSA
jgi:hypothetical protein